MQICVMIMADHVRQLDWSACLERLHQLSGQMPDDEQQAGIIHYVELLLTWNRVYNLIGPEAEANLLTRHIPNSVTLLPLLPTSGKIADMGSGAGLPGVILALLSSPERHFFLYESNQKKVRFLTHIRTELRLEQRLTIRNQRIEAPHLDSSSFDVAICRALAELPVLARLARHLLAPGGTCLALKGKLATSEIQAFLHSRQAAHFSSPILHTLPQHPESVIVQLQLVSRETGMRS